VRCRFCHPKKICETPFGGRFAHPESFWCYAHQTAPTGKPFGIHHVSRAQNRLTIPIASSFHSSPKVAARTDSQPGARKSNHGARPSRRARKFSLANARTFTRAAVWRLGTRAVPKPRRERASPLDSTLIASASPNIAGDFYCGSTYLSNCDCDLVEKFVFTFQARASTLPKHPRRSQNP